MQEQLPCPDDKSSENASPSENTSKNMKICSSSDSDESSEDEKDNDVVAPVQRRCRPCPEESGQDDDCDDTLIGDDDDGSSVLEKATDPVQFGDVAASSSPKKEDAEEVLDTSNDSTDSEDTVIVEMDALGQGLLSLDDMDELEGGQSRGDGFKNGPSDELDRNFRDVWLNNDSSTASDKNIDVLPQKVIEAKAKSQTVVPINLIEQFLQMADPKRSETEEKDISRHCAFAMPAVALTLGRSNWPVVRDTYRILSQNFQWRVRRAIAYSMHEVAAIIGGEYATTDLIPIFKEYAVNETECVRIGVLENMAAFIRALPPAERVAMLPHLKHFFGINDRRHRQEFGKQLMQVIDFYRPPECEEYLKLYCLILLTDNVVYNRQNCFGLVSKLIQRLGCEGDTSYVTSVADTLCKRFAMDASWSKRQTFAFLSGRIFADRVMSVQMFAKLFLPRLVVLADDKVPNVRLVVAQVMTEHLVDEAYFQDPTSMGYTSLHETYARLQRDRDRDVRHYANSPLSKGIDFLETNSMMGDEEVEPLVQYPITSEY